MKFDVAIVGSGLAGLSVALHLAKSQKVVIVSKRALLDGASNWAQGGIAAVLDSGDSHAEHIADTLGLSLAHTKNAAAAAQAGSARA